jgi:hypothetical protein
MCNLSQGIVEETERETTEKIIMNMCESNFTVEQIALATRKTVEEVQAIIESNQAAQTMGRIYVDSTNLADKVVQQ